MGKESLERLLKNSELSTISARAAIEIDCFLGKRELPSNNFVRLSELILGTLNPQDYSKGKREIDEYDIRWFFLETLKQHSDEMGKKKKDINYTLGKEIYSTLEDFKLGKPVSYPIYKLIEEMVPVVYTMGNDLRNFSQLSREKQEELKSLALTISNNSSHYMESFRRYLTAS